MGSNSYERGSKVSGNISKPVFALVILVFVFFVILIMFAGFLAKSVDGLGKLDLPSGGNGRIAVVEVKGVIMESKKVIELLHKAEKNEDIKGIVVRINSPGGAVGPTQEIYEEIVRIDEKKPVYSSFETIAASGGYYIAAATRKIYSNPGTLTGSIGVIMQFANMSKLYDFVKIKPETLKAGRYKDIGSPSRDMTAEERALLQETLTSVHKQFINDIVKRRKKQLKKSPNEFAQGQIFSGENAFKIGLVDALGGLWKAGRDLHEELKLEGEFDLKFIKAKKKFNIWEFAESLDEAISPIKEGLQSMNSFPMFLAK